MFNLVVLTGRLTADPELKYTTNNIPVTSFTIAVDRKYKQGEERQTDFINIVAWRNTAEFVTKYFSKGSMIGIEGSIQTRKYEDKDGNKRTAFEVVANNAQFVERKAETPQEMGKRLAEESKPQSNDFEEIPNPNDDDLPF